VAVAHHVEYISVVGAVKDDGPSAVPLVVQPNPYEVRYVSLGLAPTGQFDGLGNGPEAFLDARLRGCMNPEDPSGGCFLGGSVGELDSQLRFAAPVSLSPA
jgi:hypothetical protein